MIPPKKIDYKIRLKKAFEAIIIMCDLKKSPTMFKRIKKISQAQLVNLNNVVNKDIGQEKI